jgi:hypothetical protein
MTTKLQNKSLELVWTTTRSFHYGLQAPVPSNERQGQRKVTEQIANIIPAGSLDSIVQVAS